MESEFEKFDGKQLYGIDSHMRSEILIPPI